MNEHSSSAIKAVPNEGIGGWKVLKDVLIFQVVHLHDQMLIILE